MMSSISLSDCCMRRVVWTYTLHLRELLTKNNSNSNSNSSNSSSNNKQQQHTTTAGRFDVRVGLSKQSGPDLFRKTWLVKLGVSQSGRSRTPRLQGQRDHFGTWTFWPWSWAGLRSSRRRSYVRWGCLGGGLAAV